MLHVRLMSDAACVSDAACTSDVWCLMLHASLIREPSAVQVAFKEVPVPREDAPLPQLPPLQGEHRHHGPQ